MENREEKAYKKARERAKAMRGFYFNLMCYCIVIPTLIIVNLVYTPEFYWFYYSMFGWGIGLCFHGMEAFQYNPFLGKDWEERKIKELLEKEKAKEHKNNNQ